jgi:hypothetical protein
MCYTYKILKSGAISVYCNGTLTCIIDFDFAISAGYENPIKYFYATFQGKK